MKKGSGTMCARCDVILYIHSVQNSGLSECTEKEKNLVSFCKDCLELQQFSTPLCLDSLTQKGEDFAVKGVNTILTIFKLQTGVEAGSPRTECYL